MKYTFRQYASALLRSYDKKSEREKKEVIKRFFTLLQKQNILSRFPQILREVERQSLKKAGLRKVFVESAGEISSVTRREIKKTFGNKILLQEKENPELLAGIKVLVDDEVLVDASGKRRLEKLF